MSRQGLLFCDRLTLVLFKDKDKAHVASHSAQILLRASFVECLVDKTDTFLAPDTNAVGICCPDHAHPPLPPVSPATNTLRALILVEVFAGSPETFLLQLVDV